MSDKCLIIPGGSSSKHLLADYCARWPDHEIWTLGRGFARGSSRHFEPHFDRSLNRAAVELAKLDGVPVVISPLQNSAHPLETPFPLDDVFEQFGVALFDLTIDYALAFALLQRARGLMTFDRIALPGHDLDDAVHHISKGAAQFWLGALTVTLGKGRIEIPPTSTILRRMPSILMQIFPFHQWDSPLYGHPVEVTKKLNARYGWRT